MSNSNNIHVRPEDFSKAVEKLIVKYGDEAYDIAADAAKTAARTTTRDLKSNSPVYSGSYAKGWSHKAQKDGAAKYSETVYNRTDYQLTHLLEKPHDTGGGGHYPKNKDHTGVIERIEDRQTDAFMAEVMRKL